MGRSLSHSITPFRPNHRLHQALLGRLRGQSKGILRHLNGILGRTVHRLENGGGPLLAMDFRGLHETIEILGIRRTTILADDDLLVR